MCLLAHRVHSFYPLIPECAVEVLESPLPYIAGIHKCLFPTAKDHIGHGTLVVDLDQGQVYVNCKSSATTPDGPCDPLATPDEVPFIMPNSVICYLEKRLSQAESKLPARVKAAARASRSSSDCFTWIDSLSEDVATSYSEQLARPFLDMNINLFGCYCYFVLEAKEVKDRPEVDVEAMLDIQNCPALNPFLQCIYDCQMARLFFDQRIVEKPDMQHDLFEMTSRSRDMAITANSFNLNTKTRQRHRMSSEAWPLGISPSKMLANYGDANWLKCKSLKARGRSFSSHNIRRFFEKNLPSISKRPLPFSKRARFHSGFSSPTKSISYAGRNYNANENDMDTTCIMSELALHSLCTALLTAVLKKERPFSMEMNGNHHLSIAKRLSRTPSLLDTRNAEVAVIDVRPVAHYTASTDSQITLTDENVSSISATDSPQNAQQTMSNSSMTLNRRSKPIQYDAVHYKMTNRIDPNKFLPPKFRTKCASTTRKIKNGLEDRILASSARNHPPPRPPMASCRSSMVSRQSQDETYSSKIE
ncbi:hypothetical protein Ciccas_004339 [Cichlidogyrus casuarinus]|uniref:UDENN domain-containing protein n=1 Tax=Cichlidogyrus casuarinus TaxID=1844966 RepID=A0ABD2QCQ9_9PLAT